MAERQRRARKPAEPERKDFWDEFASIGEARAKAQGAGGAAAGVFGAAAKPKSSVGTAAMAKKASGAPAGKANEWEDW